MPVTPVVPAEETARPGGAEDDDRSEDEDWSGEEVTGGHEDYDTDDIDRAEDLEGYAADEPDVGVVEDEDEDESGDEDGAVPAEPAKKKRQYKGPTTYKYTLLDIGVLDPDSGQVVDDLNMTKGATEQTVAYKRYMVTSEVFKRYATETFYRAQANIQGTGPGRMSGLGHSWDDQAFTMK